MKAWTGPEEKQLINLHCKFSLKDCAEILNRSIYSIQKKVDRLFLTRNPHGQAQIYFAEDIAHILELAGIGFTHGQIAMCFNTTRKSIGSTISKARKYGFDKYPKRPVIN